MSKLESIMDNLKGILGSKRLLDLSFVLVFLCICLVVVTPSENGDDEEPKEQISENTEPTETQKPKTLEPRNITQTAQTFEQYPRLVLHDIEVINVETKETTRLQVNLGDKIKLEAIPHSYTIEGEDVGDKIPDFNPKWSAPRGTFVPSDGPEVIFVVPYDVGGSIGFWIEVKQTNVEGKVIKGSIWVGIVK